MKKLVVYGLLLSLTACAGSPPAPDRTPNPALDVFRETGVPLTEELKERRTATMTSMVRATGLEPVEAILVRDGYTLGAKIKGAGGCTVALSYSYKPAGKVTPESILFSFVVYNARGERLVTKHPVVDAVMAATPSPSPGFDPNRDRDLKDWPEVRHCSDPVK